MIITIDKKYNDSQGLWCASNMKIKCIEHDGDKLHIIIDKPYHKGIETYLKKRNIVYTLTVF